MFTFVDFALSALAVLFIGGWIVQDVRAWLREISR